MQRAGQLKRPPGKVGKITLNSGHIKRLSGKVGKSKTPPFVILILIESLRTPLLLSLLHSAGEETIRLLLTLGENPGARDMVSCMACK